METAATAASWTSARVYHGLRRRVRRTLGLNDTHWARVVMDRQTAQFVSSLDYRSMNALEISGSKWSNFGFAEYHAVDYPTYDICNAVLSPEAFDLVIAEQVLEHVLWPYRAARNVFQMLKPGGIFVVSTPFLLRVHNYPVDCSRWTPLGLKCLLAEGGFPLHAVVTGSWGNRACVRSNLNEWTRWTSWLHSLKNEADFPVVVWAFARKPGAHEARADQSIEAVSVGSAGQRN